MNAVIPMEVIEQVDSFSNPELDSLPFGAIQLDRNGTILRFNEYEANLSNRRAPETVGKNFFTQVAPCANVQQFQAPFAEGLELGALHVTFPYRFEFKPQPRNVDVTLYYSQTTGTVWVFVQEKGEI